MRKLRSPFNNETVNNQNMPVNLDTNYILYLSKLRPQGSARFSEGKAEALDQGLRGATDKIQK